MITLSAGVRSFLDEVHFAVAATLDSNGLPHQTVVWYMRDDDALIINVPESSLKYRHLQRQPHLSVCIEDGFRYATLSGTVNLIPDPQRDIYGRLGVRYQESLTQRPAFSGPPDPKIMRHLNAGRITVRMTVEHVIANGLNG
jgi:PPOX class probable F420-dependent enzyme